MPTSATSNTQAALNATKAYVDGTGGANPNGGDAGRLKLANVNQNSGIAGLGSSSAKVDASRLGSSLTSTQRFPTPYYSPSAYNTAEVTTGLTEEVIYSWTVADPGYTYKLMINGIVDGLTNRDQYYPISLVRLGSISGPILAVGYGCQESYSGAVVSQFDTPGAAYSYQIPVWMVDLDILLLGGGGGGASGAGTPLFWGDGGLAATWSTVSLAMGSGALPSGTTHINGVVGTGGAGGAVNVFSNPWHGR